MQNIREHMAVIGSDGVFAGTVDRVDDDRLTITRAGSTDESHQIPVASVARVDRHVHLNVTTAAALAATAGAGAAGSGSHAGNGGAVLPPIKNPFVERAQPRSNFYLPWVAALLALLVLILLAKSCADDRDDPAPAAPAAETRTAATTPPLAVQTVTLPDGRSLALQTGTLNYALQQYLASDEPTPRAFAFDNLNFDTQSAAIRASDQPTIDVLAQILAAHPNVRAAIVGYTDTRGDRGRNDALGQRRAEAVAGALVAKGLERDRIEAISGGEDKPLAGNATQRGQFENRRTELVVLGK